MDRAGVDRRGLARRSATQAAGWIGCAARRFAASRVALGEASAARRSHRGTPCRLRCAGVRSPPLRLHRAGPGWCAAEHPPSQASSAHSGSNPSATRCAGQTNGSTTPSERPRSPRHHPASRAPRTGRAPRVSTRSKRHGRADDQASSECRRPLCSASARHRGWSVLLAHNNMGCRWQRLPAGTRRPVPGQPLNSNGPRARRADSRSPPRRRSPSVSRPHRLRAIFPRLEIQSASEQSDLRKRPVSDRTRTLRHVLRAVAVAQSRLRKPGPRSL
jgi:hypothetical protein